MANRLKIFDTRVAVRIFASLALAAVFPLVVIVVLVYTKVSSTLEDLAQHSLDAASSSIGQQLLDRLLIAEDAIGHLAGGQLATDAIGLEAVQVVADGKIRPIFGEAFPVPELRDQDATKSTLTVVEQDGVRTILLSGRAPAGTIVGKLDESYIWEASTLVPYAMNLCIVQNSVNPVAVLFCTEELDQAGRAAIAGIAPGNAVGELGWESDEGPVMASHWELFVDSRFEGTPWLIVVSQARETALAPLFAFNLVFPYALAMSLILTLLLASVQIRRIMEPLRSLVSGTKRIAAREFSARVTLRGDNEFAELADAMNEMAARLGHQFDTITALAEIDRMILSSRSIGDVLERVLDGIMACCPGSCASVLLLDEDKQERAQLFTRLPDDKANTLHSRLTLENPTRAWLAGVAAGSPADAGWIRERIPGLPAPQGTNNAIVIPIFRADELRGAVITQVDGAGRLPGAEHARLSEYAGRLAVAVSAADHESQMFRRAHFDALTGLPNRQLCFDRLYQAIAQARREDHKLALLFIDLDRFKNVNDSHGHGLGDELLKEVGLRLTASVRDTDTVARLGGDEYVVILPHVDGIVEIESIVAKIFGLLGRPFHFGDREVSVSASIGVTVFPDDAQDAEELLQKADTAMYAAKDTGRARTEFFNEEMDRSLKERLQMQQDLRQAYKQGQFSLVYQAQLDLESGRLVCMEALLRWHHPQRGAISPSTFVPVLEEMGMIGDVGRWVVEQALTTYAGWRAEGLQLPRISVNVSGKQLTEVDFESFLIGQLKRHGLAGHNLEIELTEHCLVGDFDQTNALLGRLAGHGIRVAIDDFGTGYSSLGYLQGLQFDSLKIDRAFVQGLPSAKAVAIVEAVLAVANALGKEVIAEGIDANRQRLKLVELGCRIGQGFLLSIPIPADEVLEWSQRLDETSVIHKLIAAQG